MRQRRGRPVPDPSGDRQRAGPDRMFCDSVYRHPARSSSSNVSSASGWVRAPEPRACGGCVMRKTSKVMILWALTLAFPSPARADLIELSGGVAGTISAGGTNDFIPSIFPGPQIGGYYGADILFGVSPRSTLIFDFFGAEALFINSFEFLDSPLFV